MEGLKLRYRKDECFFFFYSFLFYLCLNTVSTISVWYVSKCGYVSHDSIVSHEVSKSIKKDRKPFTMQTQALSLVFKRVGSYSKTAGKKIA